MTLRAVSSSVPPGKQSPYILAQSAVPVCLAPNGTVATNGVVTLVTALPTTYSGGIWLRLPADAIVSGLAGLYWAVMTSTTAGQVYTNFSDPATEFIPSIPSGALVAAVGSNAAYTQTTSSDITLTNVLLPGGSLGSRGQMYGQGDWSSNGGGGVKSANIKVGGTSIYSVTVNTSTVCMMLMSMKNRDTSRQVTSRANAGLSAATSGTYVFNSIDTTVDKAITITVTMATATDWLIVEGFCFQVLPS